MNNNGKGLLMSWPRYVEGTTSISRLMHKQTYYRNDYIINYYIDHRLPDCRQWHAMYTAFKFITNRLILHKVCDEWGGAESRGNGARPVE